MSSTDKEKLDNVIFLDASHFRCGRDGSNTFLEIGLTSGGEIQIFFGDNGSIGWGLSKNGNWTNYGNK